MVSFSNRKGKITKLKIRIKITIEVETGGRNTVTMCSWAALAPGRPAMESKIVTSMMRDGRRKVNRPVITRWWEYGWSRT
jgi:hypothetical protein